MEKENQRIVITKKILKEALLRILKKKDIDKVTVTELCSEAHINRATFYRHYSVPNDILIEIEEDLSSRARKHIILGEKVDYNTLPLKICTYIYDNQEIIKVLIKNKSEEYLSRAVNDFYRSLIKMKHKSKELKELDEESLKLISVYFAGGGYCMLKSWITEDVKRTPEEMASLIILIINKVL